MSERVVTAVAAPPARLPPAQGGGPRPARPRLGRGARGPAPPGRVRSVPHSPRGPRRRGGGWGGFARGGPLRFAKALDSAHEPEAAAQHHRAMRRGLVPAERLGEAAIRAGDRRERERGEGAVIIEDERAVTVVGEDLVVRDRPRDEAR